MQKWHSFYRTNALSLIFLLLSSEQQPLEGTVCKIYQTIKIKCAIINIHYSGGFIYLLHECTQNTKITLIRMSVLTMTGKQYTSRAHVLQLDTIPTKGRFSPFDY